MASRASTTGAAVERGALRGDGRCRGGAGGSHRGRRPSAPDTDEVRALVMATPECGIAIARASDGGTNAVSMRPPGKVETHFGEPDSAVVHERAAWLAGADAHVLDCPGLAFDIDTPEDLAKWRADARLQGLRRAVRPAGAPRPLGPRRDARARHRRRLRPLPALAAHRRAQSLPSCPGWEPWASGRAGRCSAPPC